MCELLALALLPTPDVKKAGSQVIDESSLPLSIFHLGSNSDRTQVSGQLPNATAVFGICLPTNSLSTAVPIEN